MNKLQQFVDNVEVYFDPIMELLCMGIGFMVLLLALFVLLVILGATIDFIISSRKEVKSYRLKSSYDRKEDI